MNQNPSRRELLKLASLAGAGLAIPNVTFAKSLFGATPSAGATKDNFFVLLRIQPGFGGLDVTLGLDPWVASQLPLEKDMFVEYKADEVLKAGNLFLGPAAKALAPYATDSLIVNGVFLNAVDNGHGAALGYMSTGSGQGKAGDLPVEFEAIRGKTPYGLLSAAFSLNTGVNAIAYTRAADVLSSRHDADPTAALERAVQDGRTPLQRAIKDVVDSKDATIALQKILKKMEDDGMKLTNNHVVAASFLAGASKQAQVDFQVQGTLDTHNDHPGTHLSAQSEAWTQVAEVFKLFKSLPYGSSGESLFDRTTFMVVSEFSRTPALNGAKGKDHNPMTNSVLFAGYGIQKNKVINKSLLITAAASKTGDSYHMGSPFDYSTGLPATSRQGASFIYPQNLVASVAKAVGVDLTKLSVVPSATSIIPGFAL